MDTFFSQLSSLSLLSITVRLLLTTVFAGTLGYERERHRQAAGFRTYIIVADAAALVMMTNLYIGDVFGSTDLVRMPASVITGLGFLGAGTILVTKSHEIKGLTTAAGLWAVSIIGTAIGAGFYTGGTVCYAFILLAMNVLRLVDVRIQSRQKTATVYFELRSKLSIGQLVRLAREKDCTLSELELYADSGYGDNLVCGACTRWAEVHRSTISFGSSAPSRASSTSPGSDHSGMGRRSACFGGRFFLSFRRDVSPCKRDRYPL